MPVVKIINPAVTGPQSIVIDDATPNNDGTMTKAQAALLASLPGQLVAISSDTFANLNASFPPAKFAGRQAYTTVSPKQLFFSNGVIWSAIAALE